MLDAVGSAHLKERVDARSGSPAISDASQIGKLQAVVDGEHGANRVRHGRNQSFRETCRG